jgi:diguanylate cyclase (GGDEF)-like protein
MQGLEPEIEPPPASTHHQLFSPESWERLSEALAKTIAEGIPYELELEMFNNGTFRGWMLARGEAIRSPEGAIVGVLGVALDITQRKSRESELRKRALLDPLCQLGNRTAFEVSLAQTMKQAKQSNKSFALIMLDIDHFKEINDQHGHDVGDRALVQVAERMRSTLRGDDQIFRIGGDEFVVILSNPMPKEKLGEIAARLVLAFRTPILQLKKPLTATISAGLVAWRNEEDSMELLKRADEALYRAKSAGRNQLCSDDL